VDQTVNWDWASPPNSTFQVHDPTHGRVLMVVVYASATAAQAGLLQARAHEQAQHPSAVATTWNGPRLITGYGESIWRGNVALVQTTQAELDRLSRLQNDRDNCVYVDPDPVQETQPPSFAVDPDFLQGAGKPHRNYLKETMMAETAAAATPTHPWVAQAQGRMHFGVGGGPMGDWPALRDFV
jgi:hypothetical protein